MSDVASMAERRRRRALALTIWAGFFRCPNTGRIVEALPGDDKVLCGCGRTNPAVPREFPGCHVRRYLAAATVDEYIDQREADRAAREEQTEE